MQSEKMTQVETNDKLLISLVKPEEYLYNRYHPFYRNHIEKQNKWNDIASKVNSPPKVCKAKWKALRDQYAREMKRLARTYKDDNVRWKHFNDLDFLKKFITTRVEISGVKKQKLKIKVEEIKKETVFALDESNEDMDQHQDEENWEFLDTGAEFNEQTFENNALVDAADQSQVSVTTEIVQQQVVEHQQEDEEDDSIHTFLKIEGYFEKQLISLVKTEECLYNRKHPHYRNYDVKNSKWEDIASKLKTTVKQARLKWKALRDQYTREFKRLKRKSLKQPIKIEDVSRWRHYDALCYLEQYIRERKVKNDEELDDSNGANYSMDIDYMIEQEEYEDEKLNEVNMESSFPDKHIEILHPVLSPIPVIQEVITTTQIPTKMEHMNGGGLGIAAEDEVDAFFKAISMKVRHAKLSPVVFTDLQIEILRVINTKFRNFSDSF